MIWNGLLLQLQAIRAMTVRHGMPVLIWTSVRSASVLSMLKTITVKQTLTVLQAEGYIRGFSRTEFGNGRAELDIELKYFDGAPVIREIQRISKPGRRVYSSVKTLPQVNNGLGVSIVSTPKGVMPDWQAREENVGGEVLCRVF